MTSAVKRILMLVAVAGGLSLATSQADAGIFVRRVAPVRRVAARAVLPPYPVARRAALGPVYRPYYRPYRAVYGPRVVVGVGVY